MDISEFDFTLPEELIALRPIVPRDSSRLLRVCHSAKGEDNVSFKDSSFFDLTKFVNSGDVLVFNDTKVIPARLYGDRISRNLQLYPDVKIEAMLHLRHDSKSWQAFIRPAKRIKIGDKLSFSKGLKGTIVDKQDGGNVIIEFNYLGVELDNAIQENGELPLPPYIAGKRQVDNSDFKDYQTIFAEKPGAVAAPTAGLHFTPQLIEDLYNKNIKIVKVTLHVGAGTFLPVKVSNINEHKMHSELGVITDNTANIINDARQQGSRVIAVGTTSLRLLETAAIDNGIINSFHGNTDIFIKPGYKFKAVDMLITNFHLPKSTLFMLVSAFSGVEVMRNCYAHAISNKYRFYSYGDACFLPKII